MVTKSKNGIGPEEDYQEKIVVSQPISIPEPNFHIAEFLIRGVAPYVQNRFSQKAQQQLHDTQAAGSTARKGTKRAPKDFAEVYEGAKHVSTTGWLGIPAPAFRIAMISACRTVGFQMTKAKLCVFIEPDGFDAVDSTPLVRITKGEPKLHESVGRNSTGVIDLRVRPMWEAGWEAIVRVKYDADLFTLQDVANLMMRVGLQVGIGEGRPDSRDSAGQGWGHFELVKGIPSEEAEA